MSQYKTTILFKKICTLYLFKNHPWATVNDFGKKKYITSVLQAGGIIIVASSPQWSNWNIVTWGAWLGALLGWHHTALQPDTQPLWYQFQVKSSTTPPTHIPDMAWQPLLRETSRTCPKNISLRPVTARPAPRWCQLTTRRTSLDTPNQPWMSKVGDYPIQTNPWPMQTCPAHGWH